MDTLLIISTIFFILSIIIFFIGNGKHKLTLKQIIVLSGHQIKRRKSPYLIIFSTFPDLLLVFSIVTLIIYLDCLPALILIFGGLLIYILQKIIILLISRFFHLKNN